jgi:hypothetical protein
MIHSRSGSFVVVAENNKNVPVGKGAIVLFTPTFRKVR